jgi:hypothetical protein
MLNFRMNLYFRNSVSRTIFYVDKEKPPYQAYGKRAIELSITLRERLLDLNS